MELVPDPDEDARKPPTLPLAIPEHAHSPDDAETGTPSSTTAEFGDGSETGPAPAALELVGNTQHSSHRSRLDRLLDSLFMTLLREGWDRELLTTLLAELRLADQGGAAISAAEDALVAEGLLTATTTTTTTTTRTRTESSQVASPESATTRDGRVAAERQLYRRAVEFLLSERGMLVEVRELERDLVLAGDRAWRRGGNRGPVEEEDDEEEQEEEEGGIRGLPAWNEGDEKYEEESRLSS